MLQLRTRRPAGRERARSRGAHFPSWTRVYSTTARICRVVRTPANEGMVSNGLTRPFVTTAISSSMLGKSLVTCAASLASWQLAQLAWKICTPCCWAASEVDGELVVLVVWFPPPPHAANTTATAATSPIAQVVHRHVRKLARGVPAAAEFERPEDIPDSLICCSR